MAQRRGRKGLPEGSQQSSRIDRYFVAVRKYWELSKESQPAILETLMVTAWMARPRGTVVPYEKAIGLACFHIRREMAQAPREREPRPPEIPAQSCGEDLMDNRRSKSKEER
jgi:hypothetical protein